MLYVEFNMEDAKRVWKQEAMEIGKAVGRVEGRARGLKEGREEGISEGRAQGNTEATIRLAEKLLNSGMNVEAVANYTELDIKKIIELQRGD